MSLATILKHMKDFGFTLKRLSYESVGHGKMIRIEPVNYL